MLHAAMKIIWVQKWKLLPAAKIKTCFRWSPFIIDYISAYKLQMAFMILDFGSDKPRMKAELRVNQTEPNSKQYHVTYSSLQTGTKLLV